MDDVMWKEMLLVLKDISGYLEKQDAVQERAKIEKPPTGVEAAKVITGGPAAANAPAGDVAKTLRKEYQAADKLAYEAEPHLSADKKDAGTMLKELGDEEESTDEEVPSEAVDDDGDTSEEEEKEEMAEEDTGSDEELKSLLKDIRSALTKSTDLSGIVKSEVKKQLPGLNDKMLRKMGFTPTRPDVTKLDVNEKSGIEKSDEIKKSEDKIDSNENIAVKGVEDLSKKTWQELGQLRERQGLFRPF